MHTLDYRLVIGSIELPAAWEHLVEVDFPENLEGISSADGLAISVGDPEPYYDDYRTFTNDLCDGSVLYTHLYSGQGNYWAEHEVYHPDRGINDRVGPLAHFGDVEEFDLKDRKYVLSVNWK